MKFAYIISAYKYPSQLHRLVHRLNCPNSSFFIHIDQNTDYRTYSVFQSGLSHLTNVHFLNRHRCRWGDFGHVKATLKGIQAILDHPIEFDYVHLLTGQCYPLQSNEALFSFFEENRGKSFMEFFPITPSTSPYYSRISRWHFHMPFRKFPLPFPNPLLPLPLTRTMSQYEFPFFYGSSYWSLHIDCILYIRKFLNLDAQNQEQAFLRFFEMVSIPDEFFFQTILMNSPLCEQISNDCLRYVDFAGQPHPQLMGGHSFNLLKSSGKLFARKFDSTWDAKILDLLDVDTNSLNHTEGITQPFIEL